VNSPYRVSTSPRPGAGDVCSCCLRPWSECFTGARRPGDQPRQRTCPPCHEHGPNGLLASHVHAELWRDLDRAHQRYHDATEAGLRNQIAQLEQELHDRPVRTVAWWWSGWSWSPPSYVPCSPITGTLLKFCQAG
jgi:hypothetical protein